MHSVALVAIAVVLAVVLPTPVRSGAANIAPLKGYPLLQCGVCELMALEIGRRVNITNRNNRGASYMSSHRLPEHGKHEENDQRRQDYAASELQAVEVLELLCQDIRKAARFVVHPKGETVRIIVADSEEYKHAKPAKIYSTKEEAKLGNIEGRVADFCEAVLEDYEEVLTRAIKRHKRADKLVEGICRNGIKVCEQSILDAGTQEEHRRFELFKKTEERNAAKLANAEKTSEPTTKKRATGKKQQGSSSSSASTSQASEL
jgi:hypothetical protein